MQIAETTEESQLAHWRITTSNRPTPTMVSKAEVLAESMGLVYVARGGSSVQRLRRLYPDGGWLVVQADATLMGLTPDGQRMQWHLGLAKSRIAAAEQNEPDYLLQSLSPEPGQRYFDGNLGMAHDALLIASRGALVVAMEIDPIVRAITESGLHALANSDAPLADAAQRIEILEGNHETFLQNAAANSFDGIFFSPMFVEPDFRANDLDGLREIAHHQWLHLETLTEARRVSSKVVVKLERGCHPEMPEPSRWLGSPRRRLHYALYERPVEETSPHGKKEE